MKKFTAGLLAAAMALTASATAFAAESYNVSDKSVTSDDAAGKKTVIITKGALSDTISDSDIYYVGQADSNSTFTDATKFLIKDNPAEGEYTITLGGSGEETVSKTFYIGMTNNETDVELTNVGENDNGDGTKNVGYLIGNVSGTFSGVIIKTAENQYLGAKLNANTITVEGASIGIQINGIASDDVAGTTVYLTSRDFTLAAE